MEKTVSTHDEATNRCLLCMGDELGKYYRALDIELTGLYHKWNEFCELFGNTKSVDLLNATAPGFFCVIQESLWHDMILGVTKLLDDHRPRKGQFRLALGGLRALIRVPSLARRVDGLINLARKDEKFCRDWRNRRIAHSDLNLAMGNQTKPLQAATVKNMNTVLIAIAAVLNAVREHYLDGQMSYEDTESHDGVSSLLAFLRLGVRAARERQDRLKAGKRRPEDWGTHEP
jgi:hypothetical protein